MSKNIVLDDEVIAKIKKIQFRAKHLVSTSFAGEYQSAFRGRGMEFDEVREYFAGDDVRSIDWNVTARTNDPHIKVFKDERELTVMFIVDVSASCRFGTFEKFKNEIAAEITATLAYMALNNNDKVGLIIFSDHVEHFIAPKKGREHIWKLIRDILTFEPKSHKTNFGTSLEFLNKIIKKKAISFLISDFVGIENKKELIVTAKRHDLTAIYLFDPKEIELPNVGYIELEDAETGENILINTTFKSDRDKFNKLALSKIKQREEMMRKYGISFIKVDVSKPYIDPLLDYFKKRERRR